MNHKPVSQPFPATIFSIFAIFIFLTYLPFSVSAQRLIVGKFHLTLRPFSRWAAAQMIPSMYNLKNEMAVSLNPFADGNMELISDQAMHHGVVNHYPMRIVFFTTNRQSMVFHQPVYVYLRSSYRGREFGTEYLLVTTPKNMHIQFLNSYERTVR